MNLKLGKRFLAATAAAVMASTVFVGCSSNAASDASSKDEQSKEKIIIDIGNDLDNQALVKAIDEIKGMEKYANVEFKVADRNEEYDTTMPIKIASGEQVDIIATFNQIQQASFAQEGMILPLDEYIDAAGIDFEKEFGPYTQSAINDGNYYIVPYNTTKWALYYNKKLFDDAGIPYPDEDKPMTWAEYRDLAAKLTSGEGSDKVYGALHLDWPMFWYGEAIMDLGGGEQFYTEDGLSNIEDPAFKNALEQTYRMMHTDKSIPTYADIKTSKTTPQAFFNGKYAMIAQGAWMLNWAADSENYPRDWQIGICPLPVDEGENWKTWGNCSGFAISKTSANPQLAFEISMEMDRLAAKYATTEQVAIQTVPQSDLYVGIASHLTEDELTPEIIQKYFLAQDQIFITEKVTGPNSARYENVILEEVEKYFVQAQDIDTTIANIKKRGDEIITSED